jgi:hypothetical protein
MDFTPRQPLARDQDMRRQRQPERHGVEQDGGARHRRQVEREKRQMNSNAKTAPIRTPAPQVPRGRVTSIPRQRIQA